MKNEIIELRKNGKTYKEIVEILGCSKAVVSYHCKNNKEFTISHNVNKSWSKIEKELEKCILLCANCHRELHENNQLEI